MMKKRLLLILLCTGLTGCATASFAPPSVNLENEMHVPGSNYSFGQRCMPNERLDSAKNSIRIREDVQGARRLIDNFIYMYRCRAHTAANGRQAFDIPSFLALAGTSAATVFGAGPNVAIAGGYGNSLFSNGAKYYAAQRKAEIYDHSLDALVCIKSEAAGIDAFTVDAISNVEKTSGDQAKQALKAAFAGEEGEGGEVTITSKEQYFDMVSAALLSVERVAAQRLSTAGTPFDASGVMAEMAALQKKTEPTAAEGEEADEEAAALQGPAAGAEVPPGLPQGAVQELLKSLSSIQGGNEAAAGMAAKANLKSVPQRQVSETILKLKTLQPKLEQCVLRAKV
jgi:hypothetical protein